jgi:Tfp pilus assembly protein PilV
MTLQCKAGRARALRGSVGLSLVEILVAAFITGAAVIGLSLMFATGSAWVTAMGDDRVAAGLAQQSIERMRTALIANWAAAAPSDEILDPAGCGDTQNNARCRQTTKYLRVTSIECVDDSTPAGLGTAIPCPTTSDPLKTKRITVSVTPVVVDDGGAQSPVQRASVVTLQGWISPLGR